MLKAMPIVYYVYAAVLVAGGIMGSVASQKPSSLIGSAVFGAGAVAGGVLYASNPRLGLIIGLLDAIAVAIFFVYRYSVTQKAMPAFPSIGLSVVVAILSIIALTQLTKPTVP